MSVVHKVTAREEGLHCHGLYFLCIFGRHVNGGYVAIANWNAFAELAVSTYELAYNRKNILEALERSTEAIWLPSDSEERSAIARDLAMMIVDRIQLYESLNFL